MGIGTGIHGCLLLAVHNRKIIVVERLLQPIVMMMRSTDTDTGTGTGGDGMTTTTATYHFVLYLSYRINEYSAIILAMDKRTVKSEERTTISSSSLRFADATCTSSCGSGKRSVVRTRYVDFYVDSLLRP